MITAALQRSDDRALFWFVLAAAVLAVLFVTLGLAYNRDPAAFGPGGLVRHRVIWTTAKVIGVVLGGLLVGVALGLAAGALLG